MRGLHSFELAGADGKLIRGDRSMGKDRQILFYYRLSLETVGQ